MQLPVHRKLPKVINVASVIIIIITSDQVDLSFYENQKDGLSSWWFSVSGKKKPKKKRVYVKV